jgi:Carboxypeptidase regulatory-like domain
MYRTISSHSSLFSKVRVGLFLSLFTVVLIGGGIARAQLSGQGEIKGTVKDPSGAVVANAVVTATEGTTGLSITRKTSSSGDYDMSPVDPGIYSVSTVATGFEKLTQNNVHVNALEIVDYNPVLTVGSASETVTVSSAPPQLETSNATLGATMEQEMYSALPIEMGAYGSPDQRRATDFAFLMPGVQGNNTNGNPTTNTGVVNGSGSRGAVSAVYIDGLPFVRAGGNGDPRYVWTAMSVDAVDQFQVQTSGYSAIYEGQGIQNYTIKQGGKNFHGSVYEFFRNTALDTWGFFGPVPNPATGTKVKPVEHSNEYGINLSGPLVPFGTWRDKLFFFGNYNGFRYTSATPTQMTFPTSAQQTGNFHDVLPPPNGVTVAQNDANPTGLGIYDPSTQTACTSHSTNGPCRYRYGYAYSGTPGPAGGPSAAPVGAVDVIPASQFSAIALTMQSFLPSGIGTGLQNNYISQNRTGLTNWSTTDRIDYNISGKDTLTMVMAIGRQASSNPVGQTTTGRNVGPVPYNYGQTYAPKTAVGVIEETHIFTPNIVNQIKYGYARYNGPTFDADQVPQYAASAMGISYPVAVPGAATSAFPITTFAGTNAPTNWGGTGPGVTIAENYTLLDNVQWVKGNHTLTFGGQIAWLLYNVVNATGGSTPLTLANAVTETAAITPSSNSTPKYAATSGSGLSYASFLIGQIDKASFTQYLQTETASRFRAISPYVQDNWKVSSKLTLDLGLRYDFFPSITEVHNAQSFYNPTLANPVTLTTGALQFAGNGTNTCNCSTPVNNYHKNFGPRLGLAYQVDPKTVIRASYGVMFTHGNAVGGSATSLGTLGFSGGLSSSANGSLLSMAPLTGSNGILPGFTAPTGAASGPQFGTGYTTVSGYTVTPQSMGYTDPYLGSRAPEYINYTFGFQHSWTNALTSTITYVGSQGHFLPTDGGNPRGYWSDQLDPKYLSLGSNLTLTGAALTTFCGANAGVCPATLSVFNTGQPLSQLLKPFPFQGVSDTFGYVGNSNYHSLQTTLNLRASHGLTFMANYTWSRAIDDGGTFRSGYAIPAGFIANAPNASYAADRIERTISTSNQPQHIVVTGVWDLPLGKTFLGSNAVERAILGGYKFSEIFQAFSGSPLAITGSTCNTNPAQSTCEPALNPAFSGNAHINGKWGHGYQAGQSNAPTYINSSAFAVAPAYTFGNSPRTAPYNLYGPGNFNLDLALVRSFPLHWEGVKLNFRAEMYNVSNHTKFNVASTAFGNSSFGQVTTDPTATRKSVQLSGRIEF